MKVYVAGSFADRWESVSYVMSKLVYHGHTITYDWRREDDTPESKAVADVMGVAQADFLVAVMVNPHLTYRGTYVEMGLALALGKPIYVIGDAGQECIFLHHPLVRRGWPNREKAREIHMIEEGINDA